MNYPRYELATDDQHPGYTLVHGWFGRKRETAGDLSVIP